MHASCPLRCVWGEGGLPQKATCPEGISSAFPGWTTEVQALVAMLDVVIDLHDAQYLYSECNAPVCACVNSRFMSFTQESEVACDHANVPLTYTR